MLPRFIKPKEFLRLFTQMGCRSFSPNAHKSFSPIWFSRSSSQLGCGLFSPTLVELSFWVQSPKEGETKLGMRPDIHGWLGRFNLVFICANPSSFIYLFIIIIIFFSGKMGNWHVAKEGKIRPEHLSSICSRFGKKLLHYRLFMKVIILYFGSTLNVYSLLS